MDKLREAPTLKWNNFIIHDL